MIPVCGIPALVAFFAYGTAGLVVGVKLMQHGKNGTPTGLAAFSSESYTPEGQRLFKLLIKGWVIGLPIVAVVVALVGGAICRAVGWTPGIR